MARRAGRMLSDRLGSWAAIALALALAGCASTPPATSEHWDGPQLLSAVSIEQFPKAGLATNVVRTAHYKIFTTIDDNPDLLNHMGQLMEGAYATYRSIAPDLPPTQYPMICYLFANRSQWEQFTEKHTGMDARIYLRIGRGGYTIHDWYVAYYLGDASTYSVAAHEGWHQFVNRHFVGRIPPFLEEGIACMFENVEWSGDLPRWNLESNPTRALSLRKAIDEGQLFPLEQLVTMHAGQVVSQSSVRIEAFYAQDWAFARYLWEGENGKYRPALQRLLADAASGQIYDPTGSARHSYLPWKPQGVRPMLEHYLGISLTALEPGYQKFMQHIADEEIQSQFQM